MTDRERERYLASSTNIQHLVRLTLAVRARIPKKYQTQLHALFKRIRRSSRRINSPSRARSCATSGTVRLQSCPGSCTS